eukprot:scaffold1521_cov271-Chaetoceros_neogracile.AAC.66
MKKENLLFDYNVAFSDCVQHESNDYGEVNTGSWWHDTQNDICAAKNQLPAAASATHFLLVVQQDDIDEILLDIKQLYTILAGACRFIKSLFTWPGVSDAISDVGSWGVIESLAKIFWICNLAHEMASEDHFILLEDVKALVTIIEST